MEDVELFALAMGVVSPWLVKKVTLEEQEQRVTINLDFERGARFACSESGRAGLAVHDTETERWRHLTSSSSGHHRSGSQDALSGEWGASGEGTVVAPG